MSNERSTYERLSAKFDTSAHKKVQKGGREQTYVPWTDKVERLNEVLGSNWSFRIVREGLTNTEAWALGEITAIIDGVETVRQQYGCEPITMGRNETPTGDLFKKAGTDALGKAASLLGVGLYLSSQEERAEVEAAMRAEQAAARRGNRPAPSGTQRTPSSGGGGSSTPAPSNDDRAFYSCAECRERVEAASFNDGSSWSVDELVGRGRRSFGRVLCIDCFRKAADAKKKQAAG